MKILRIVAALFAVAAANLTRDGNHLDPITHRVFFDFHIDGEFMGRVEFGLYGNTVPKTVKNFVALADGTAGKSKAGKPMHYKGNRIHRIIPAFMAQMGDFENGDGTGGESIYGGSFIDENFHIRHTKPYLLTMANTGRNTNTSQFLITLRTAAWLDGRHVVFGEVLSGFETIDEMEKYGVGAGEVIKEITIGDCGTYE